jgi:hypothetical protein
VQDRFWLLAALSLHPTYSQKASGTAKPALRFECMDLAKRCICISACKPSASKSLPCVVVLSSVTSLPSNNGDTGLKGLPHRHVPDMAIAVWALI